MAFNKGKSMRMREKILIAGVALASVFLARSGSAAVTAQGWWHVGETGDYYGDSSGNNRRFGSGFSCVGSGNAGAGIVALGAGGPLGTTGYTSTSSTYWTPLHCGAAAMWNPWTCGTPDCAWNPPATNYTIECWILPEDTGIGSTAAQTWFFASGSGDFSQPSRPAGTGAGGVYFAITNDTTLGYSRVGAFVIPNAAQGVADIVQIGDYVDANTNGWTHIAVVNDNGVNTFYVNGVAHGASTPKNTIPNGNIFAGGSPGTTPCFRGYLDELRITTFLPGQFSTNDLLLRPVGPSIVGQPASASVWAKGAANFAVTAALDSSLTFQWRREGTNIAGATGPKLNLPLFTTADNGATFDCILKSGGISATSTVATLTIVSPTASDLANANAYRDVVKAEPGLVAYFPADDNTGGTVVNAEDSAFNGTLEGNAVFDGQTNRALIQRALAFDADGDVMIPANSLFDFSNGQGTVEALVYLNHATLADQTLFAVAYDETTYSYALKANAAGNGLVFANGTETLSWSLAPSLIGRRAHIAFVFNNTTNVTPYLDGQPLETKSQSGFAASGYSAYIGSLGPSASQCAGTIGELAIYTNALSGSAIQTHYTKYFYGTNVAPPKIESQTVGPKSLIAGSAPVLNAIVSGAPPFTYQWKSNEVAIAGATSASLTVVGGAAGGSATYTLSAANVFGTATSQPIALNFVAPAGTYAEKVAQDHPSAYWRLGEQTGKLAADIAGFNDATYNGALTLGVPGAFAGDANTAVNFSGGDAVAPYTPTLNPPGAFSVEFWAKPDQSGQLSRCVIGSQNRNVGRSGYAIYQGLNGAFWECHIGDAATVQIWLYGKTYPEAGKWYHVAVVHSATNSARLYVNGADDTDETVNVSTTSGSYLPNNASPFEIASRFGGGVPYPGTVDDVAFYSYALSPDQILNHYKIQWVASHVVTQPADVTAVEGNTITLSAEISGLPNTYQWYKGATALAQADNPDGTAHYPAGVTTATLTIAQATPSDAGAYHLVVTNPLGGSTTANAQVVVNKDTAPPTMVSVTALSTPNPAGGKPYLVKVLFSKRMDAVETPKTANYSLSGGVTIPSLAFLESAPAAVLGADWRTVVLTTSGLTPGQKYTLTVSGVKDQTVTGNPMPSTSVSFTAPVLTPGVLAWDYYYLGAPRPSPIDVTWLLSSSYYPFGPMTNGSPATFDTGTFTKGDLVGVAPFGALGEDYGDSLSGWITPAVAGNYTFFLSSDDPSQLLLSTDDNPANATMIAQETGCCHAFTEPPIEYTSEPQALVAGKKYFIQALHTEGGGGDYVKVAWRKDGDSTPAAELTPISGTVLSAYAPVPAARFNPTVIQNGQVTISWSGDGTLQQSPDLVTWTAVQGNPATPYTVAPTAVHMFYRLAQ